MGFIAKLIYATPFGKYYKAFNKKKWEISHQLTEQKLHPLRRKFYTEFIAPGDLVFDVGANVGNRTEIFLSCGANVVAIEPQPDCVKLLRQQFTNKIKIEAVGLSDKPGELQMHIASDTTASTFDQHYIAETKNKFKHTEWNEMISVPVTTLDILIEKYGLPYFCKIDVEGFEIHVLKGLSKPIPYLSFEYIVPERVNSAEECIRQLNSISPDGKFNYSIGESMVWAKKIWMNYDEFLLHLQTSEFLTTSFGDIYFKAEGAK